MIRRSLFGAALAWLLAGCISAGPARNAEIGSEAVVVMVGFEYTYVVTVCEFLKTGNMDADPLGIGIEFWGSGLPRHDIGDYILATQIRPAEGPGESHRVEARDVVRVFHSIESLLRYLDHLQVCDVDSDRISELRNQSPNRLVARDRNPRERGFRPVNSER